jgi:hypothetical protein
LNFGDELPVKTLKLGELFFNPKSTNSGRISLNELITFLEGHFQNLQPSERWAMYRLITPVIDYANQSMGLFPYFEYNQTSSHGTHQSVDIALLDDQESPRILIEAKRADRKVSPEQIDKYLDKTTRGVVTNGFIWILCHEGKHEAVTLFKDRLDTVSLERILGFLMGSVEINGKLSASDHVYSNPVKVRRIVNKAKVSRAIHPVTVCSIHKDLLGFIQSAEKPPTNELALLHSICTAHNEITNPECLRVEVRKTRISFFDNRPSVKNSRVARIELGKAQPDILVRTWIVDKHPELTSIAKPEIHDKGAHMRRFRLGSEEQATAFGRTMVMILGKVLS